MVGIVVAAVVLFAAVVICVVVNELRVWRLSRSAPSPPGPELYGWDWDGDFPPPPCVRDEAA